MLTENHIIIVVSEITYFVRPSLTVRKLDRTLGKYLGTYYLLALIKENCQYETAGSSYLSFGYENKTK